MDVYFCSNYFKIHRLSFYCFTNYIDSNKNLINSTRQNEYSVKKGHLIITRFVRVGSRRGGTRV